MDSGAGLWADAGVEVVRREVRRRREGVSMGEV
jgi:hypothetical protein